VRAMEAALHLRGLEFTGADFEIYSSVPVAVGLGSSTAAVLAGLLAADFLFRLKLDEKTLFELASIYESREDNLRAAWYGGFVASTEEDVSHVYRRTPVPENFVLNVVTPETSLAPGRRQSPKTERDASAHVSRAAALCEFFAQPGNGHAEALSQLLPPTCEKDVPGLEAAVKVRTPGVLAVFVCGSGPAVGILAQENAAETVAEVRGCFARKGVASSIAQFRPTNAGARDWNSVQPDVILPPLRGLNTSLPMTTFIPA